MSDVLRDFIRESIAAAAVHARKRQRERERAANERPPKRKKKRSVPSMTTQQRQDAQESVYTAIKTAGAHMTSKIWHEQIKGKSPEELKKRYDIWASRDEGGPLQRYYRHRQGPTRPRSPIKGARIALARAVVQFSNIGADPAKSIEDILTQYTEEKGGMRSRIASDVRHGEHLAKRRGRHHAGGEMQWAPK